jgi:transposase, IS5 family
MRYKAYGQRTVFDQMFEDKVVIKKTSILEEIKSYIDFEIFRKSLEMTFEKNNYGPSRYDVVLMFKILIIQQWYELSDPEVEEQISDRISFRKFLGLSLIDKIPDETTICLFRNHIINTSIYEWLFETLNDELDKRHVMVKKGAIIDATFIEAPKGKRSNGKKTDPDAKFGKKGHGYSLHVNMDIESKLIREVDCTDASVHDSQPDMLIGDEKAVFEDKAYFNDEKKKEMRENGTYCGTLDKAKRNHPLSNSQKKRNCQKSKVRSAVEHSFAQIKYNENFERTPYIGLEKTRAKCFLKVTAYNLRRGLYLLKKQANNVYIKFKTSCCLPEYCV